MESKIVSNPPQSRRGVALVTVLVLMALMLALIMAILSMGNQENRMSRIFTESQQARHLADMATSVTMSRLRMGATGEVGQEDGFWAGQPGMVRRYAKTGEYVAGYKLYSSSTMTHRGDETDLATETVPAKWSESPSRYVDLNEPVVRYGAGGTKEVHFPIVDPRAAAASGGSLAIEGFSYLATTRHEGDLLDGAVIPGTAHEDEWRVPMPVEWMYVLQDGTTGYLDESNRFQGETEPTVENPIVGRVGFWADDESGKINVNTASESTYFATPTLGNGTYASTRTYDYAWARSQPAAGEFQRYPGHPATTALSPVLIPGRTVTAFDKATLYEIVPKLEDCGTKSGTKQIVEAPTPYNTNQALGERLYSTLDEFLFAPDRSENSLSFGTTAENTNVLERARFFLTPWSRSPEITLSGTPRVAIWPVGHRADQRTIFDNLIAFCATYGRDGASGLGYYFARENADSATHDINLPRNRQLINYLEGLASATAPGYPKSFAEKYPQDFRQIIIQMFDYIRSTNLYDARLDNNQFLTGPDREYPRILTKLPTNMKTYTEGRFNGATSYHGSGFGFYPGNGQVVPTQDAGNQGFGRYYTIDEVAMLFIACADGTPNAENPYINNASIADPWKGGFAVPFNSVVAGAEPIAFSNFPPNPPAGVYGPDAAHPGYQRKHWNYALENGTPLPRGSVKVQSSLLMEFFCVAAGYQIIRGDFGIRVKNLSALKLNGAPLFHASRNTVTLKSYWDVADMVHGGYRGGGDVDTRGLLSGRKAPAIGNHPADDGYNNTGLAGAYSDLWNYDLLSEFIEVARDSNGDGIEDPMRFQATGPIEIEIFDNRAGLTSPAVQTFEIRFPTESLIPVPHMVLNYKIGGVDTIPASFFWSFHADGFNGNETAPIKHLASSGRLRGRDAMHHPWNFLYHHGRDVICSMVPWHGDYRLTAARTRVDTDPGSPWSVDGRKWTFVPHPGYPTTTSRGQHNMNHRYNWIPGFLQSANANLRLFPGAWGGQFAHDFPAFAEAAAKSHRYGDFDEAPGNIVGGAQINKPDEGNFYVGGIYDANTSLTPYFDHDWMYVGMESSFFSPNRIMPSAVMMGSLPTGVVSGDPWRTLLFRPASKTTYGTNHPGASAAKGGEDPPDHALLDWFMMPVVEPYALTEPGSTAGRVSMNYQMMPFAHIRRATGMHAVLKGEYIPKINAGGTGWHDPLDVNATLQEFDAFFATGRIFPSATRICEMPMIPESVAVAGGTGSTESRMNTFWDSFRGTGDNMKERPYVHLYPKVTTRSQTWTVHVRAQTIRKARSSDPAVFDGEKDSVSTEYRGSTTLERFLDASDGQLPDAASNPSAPSLERFYRYRLLSQRRFQP
jgi:uncharacterized protein (TIGR02600 family)